MGLMPVYYSNTNTRTRKTKKKSSSLIAAEKDLERTLKKMRYMPSKTKTSSPALSNSYGPYSGPIDRYVPKTSDIIPGGVAKKSEPMVYSGETQLIGIATMHKSNMVPIFANNKEKAKEIASMRR